MQIQPLLCCARLVCDLWVVAAREHGGRCSREMPHQVSPPSLDMASASGVRSRSLSSKASSSAPLGSVMACTCRRGGRNVGNLSRLPVHAGD